MDDALRIHKANRSLISVASKGDLEGVKNAIADNADIHIEEDYSLSIAAKMNYLDIAEYLILHDANVDAQDGAVLAQAAYYGHIEMITLLINNGVEIHANNDAALRWAAERGNAETVALLLHHGSYTDIDKAFQLAMENCHAETALILAMHVGADTGEIHRRFEKEMSKLRLRFEKDMLNLAALPADQRRGLLLDENGNSKGLLRGAANFSLIEILFSPGIWKDHKVEARSLYYAIREALPDNLKSAVDKVDIAAFLPEQPFTAMVLQKPVVTSLPQKAR